MRAEYARQYEDLWRRHWWWRSRRQFVLTRLGALYRRRPPARILDIGCGNGLFFEELRQFGEVRGIEPDSGLVSEDGPFRDRIEVREFDADYLPREGDSPDWVLMLDVLEHLEDDAAAAAHVHRILAPGGIFVVTVPALMMLWSQHDEANLHFRRYTRAGVTRVLEGAGFAVEMVRYFFGWTVGPLLLRRMLAPGTRSAGKETGSGEYRVHVPPAMINRTLYGLTRLEQLTIGRWGLPVGSSLMAVARKQGGAAGRRGE